MTLHPVILSGGTGTRLWPLSRAARPKQFLALHGEQTMIQQTALRAAVAGAAAPVILCSEAHRFVVAEQMQAAGIVPAAIVLEPVARSTAPAALVAALLTAEQDAEGVILLMPSDHVVTEHAAFAAALDKAVAAAREGYIATLGIAVTAPEVRYGYIQRGAAFSDIDGAFRIARFVEKPAERDARAFAASGNYAWNSGMFVFRADVLIAECETLAPQMVLHCRAALARAQRGPDFLRLDAEAFAQCAAISLDYAVMEKTAKAAVVPAALGWTDVGTWSSLWALEPHDADGNVLRGDIVTQNVRNALVRSDAGLTVVAGIEDVVVVVTEDAVFVTGRGTAGNAGAIVEHLKAQGRSEAAEGRTVARPWGTYRTIERSGRFHIKEIAVHPGKRLSLQLHHKRAEHWIVVEGTARVTVGNRVFDLGTNESTHIPLGERHRLENPGTGPLWLIEVQCGSYFGEDDIVRLDDDYGRA